MQIWLLSLSEKLLVYREKCVAELLIETWQSRIESTPCLNGWELVYVSLDGHVITFEVKRSNVDVVILFYLYSPHSLTSLTHTQICKNTYPCEGGGRRENNENISCIWKFPACPMKIICDWCIYNTFPAGCCYLTLK